MWCTNIHASKYSDISACSYCRHEPGITSILGGKLFWLSLVGSCYTEAGTLVSKPWWGSTLWLGALAGTRCCSLHSGWGTARREAQWPQLPSCGASGLVSSHCSTSESLNSCPRIQAVGKALDRCLSSSGRSEGPQGNSILNSGDELGLHLGKASKLSIGNEVTSENWLHGPNIIRPSIRTLSVQCSLVPGGLTDCSRSLHHPGHKSCAWSVCLKCQCSL